jgi:protein disulfide-isomerase
MRAANWIAGAWFLLWTCSGSALAQEGLRWEQSLDAAKLAAAQTGRLVLVHFGAPWCAPCQELERNVFDQPGFGQALTAHYVAVKLNADHFPATAREYGVEVLPTDVILTPQGQLVRRLASPRTAVEYVAEVQQVAAEYRGHAQHQLAQNAPSAGFSRQATPAPQQAAPRYTPPSQPQSADDRYADYFNQRPQQPSNVAGPYAGETNAARNPQPGPGIATGGFSSQPHAAAPIAQQPPTYSVAQGPTTVTPPANRFQDTGPPPQPSINNTAPADVVRPDQLPSGSPPLGLDGFCPVSLSVEQNWRPGDIRWGAVHRGRTYLFISAEAQQEFLSNPDKYSPALSGNDPVLAADQGQAVAGRREHGWFFDGGVYLFANEQTLKRFAQDPDSYAARVRQLMR